jgi:hypothetical protein
LKMLGLVWSHSDRWRRMALPNDVNAQTEDHGPILSALKTRDLRAACKALERHIHLSVKSLEQTVLAVPVGSGAGVSGVGVGVPGRQGSRSLPAKASTRV